MKNDNKNEWHFKIKINRLALGFLLVIAAVLITLDALKIKIVFFSGVSAIAIICGALLTAWAIAELVKLNIPNIVFPLAFLFMIFEKQIASLMGHNTKNLINNGLVFLIAILLHFGLKLIIPRRKRKKRINFGNGFTYEYDSNNSGLDSSNSNNLGSKIVYIDCESFKKETIENNLGASQVYFSNTDQYEGNGILHIENNLGSVKVNVPSEWKIVTDVDNNLGSVSEPTDKSSGDKKLMIVVENQLGAVQIVRV